MTPTEAVEHFGSERAAANALGVPRSTFRSRLAKERAGTPSKEKGEPSNVLTMPRFPSKRPSIEKMIAARTEHFERLHKRVESESWFNVHVRDSKPIGILWFGDPHLDDDSCNWPLLQKHVKHCATVNGLYGANIGDTTNNWAGRLARLYAEQDVSRATARDFAKWFLTSAGITWLVWIMGNHDEWESGSEILRLMDIHGKVPMLDWEARFQLVFPNRQRVRIHAAHDFPGHSMWNIGHGPMRAAKMTSDADLYVCGHKHDWTINNFEHSGRCPVAIRARGYKMADSYAVRHGFQQSTQGSAILTIIDPSAAPAGRVLAFADADQGVRVLKALRRGK